jgi:hypothetical protein
MNPEDSHVYRKYQHVYVAPQPGCHVHIINITFYKRIIPPGLDKYFKEQPTLFGGECNGEALANSAKNKLDNQ